MAAESSAPRRDWRRRYPPLISIIVAAIIALVVLPSALNLPQTNPTQTEEFAPVPPSDKTPPHRGNVSELSLGNDSTIANDVAEGPGSPPTLPPLAGGLGASGKTPTTKQCVRDSQGVLRQTDDPLSPPCVADFRGDNFGATYQGVTAQEIRILVYLQGNYIYTDTCTQADERTPDGTYFDLAQPPSGPETCDITGLRVWQRYFNDRYQTYGRFVHFYAYYSTGSGTPESRRAEAYDNYTRIKPFAVLSYGQTFEDDYLRAMAQYHVLNFGSFIGHTASFFEEFPKFIWSYLPSVEEQAANYASFVCTKMAGKPATFADPTLNGKPRKFGLLYTTDPAFPQYRTFKNQLVSDLNNCGVTFTAEATFPYSDFSVDSREAGDPYAATNMAQFKQDGITTIIWAGGVETQQSQAAAAINYFPEQLLAGDGGHADGYATEQHQNQQAWAHAWVVTFEPWTPPQRETVCFQSFKSVDPNAPDTDILTACGFYDNLRQLFTGIQVAGPRLGPTSLDQGFHAIPPVPSGDPRVPACFYDPGDYTCIKDGSAQWWDPNTAPPGSSAPGCWRASDRGLRFLTGQWPGGDVLSLKTSSDPCSDFGPFFQTNP
jgi:hypothetical protein